MSATHTSPPARPDARVHFGVFYSGVGPGVVWNDPRSRDQTEFESFRRVAQTAERGLFDAFFFGEGLRLREHLDRIIEVNVAGRPDAQTHLAAIAAVTRRIGLAATQNATFNEPYDLARRLASLDILSGGRAAWNIVTTDNAWTGENFRKGGYLSLPDRYEHAEANVRAVRAFWDAWQHVEIASDTTAGAWASAPERVRIDDRFYDLDAVPAVPVSPQGHPVLFQAGDSPGGRDLAARQADVIFSRHSELEDAAEFAADIRRRVLAAGRPADDVLILPGASIVVGRTAAEAAEKEEWLRDHTWSDQHVVAFVEKAWGHALPTLDPDGPLPEDDPEIEAISVAGGTVGHHLTPRELVGTWRALIAERGFTVRELVLHLNRQRSFTGAVDEIADRLVAAVRSGAVDGFNIGLNIVPGGLDDIVDLLVPALQERGAYPTEYVGTTLREHLGLRPPLGRRSESAAA